MDSLLVRYALPQDKFSADWFVEDALEVVCQKVGSKQISFCQMGLTDLYMKPENVS